MWSINLSHQALLHGNYTGRKTLREEIKAESLICPCFSLCCAIALHCKWGWKLEVRWFLLDVRIPVCWVDSLLGLCVDMGFGVHWGGLRGSSWLFVCVVVWVRAVSRHCFWGDGREGALSWKADYVPFRTGFGTAIQGDSENVSWLYTACTLHIDEMGIEGFDDWWGPKSGSESIYLCPYMLKTAPS